MNVYSSSPDATRRWNLTLQDSRTDLAPLQDPFEQSRSTANELSHAEQLCPLINIRDRAQNLRPHGESIIPGLCGRMTVAVGLVCSDQLS
jgi:hypothetical protein